MLVLQRKRGQTIRIGNHGEVTVKVLSTQGGVIRLGIDAPKDMLVDREEIHQQRQQVSTIKPSSSIKECADISSFDEEGKSSC